MNVYVVLYKDWEWDWNGEEENTYAKILIDSIFSTLEEAKKRASQLEDGEVKEYLVDSFLK